MQQSQDTRELVCFANFDQISALEGYRPDNPLTAQNYYRIVGWYQLPEKCGCCVQRESGILCGTLHNNGWVAQLQDQTITILGRDCANDKFGADSSVFKDIGLALNAIKARQRADRLRALMSKREYYQERLMAAERQILDARRKIESFLSDIGRQFEKRVINMARSGNSNVVVDAVRVRRYEESGHVKSETSVIKHRLGSVDGLSVLNKEQFIQLSIAIENIRKAFDAAVEIQTLSRAVQTALVTRLEECEPVLQRAAAIEENLARFFGNPYLLFCFLTDERGERSRLARLAMRQAGIDGGRDHAKEWFAAQELALINQLGVQSIRIG